jgi:hypothetical protein
MDIELKKEDVIKLYNSHFSLSEIAKETGFATSSISRNLEKWGIRKRITLNEHNKNQSSLKNPDIFESIDSYEKAYWLGFILADGSIVEKNRLQIALQLSDKNHLEKFSKFLSSDCTVREFNKTNHPFCIYSVGHIKLRIDLENKGIIVNKSNKPYTLWVPEEKYIKSFLNGYLDGDGSIRLNEDYLKKTNSLRCTFSAVGHKSICELFCKHYGGNVYKRKDSPLLWEWVKWTCNQQYVESFYDPNVFNFCLQRKLNLTYCYWPLREKLRRCIEELKANGNIDRIALTEKAKFLVKKMKQANSVPKALEVIKELESGVTGRS